MCDNLHKKGGGKIPVCLSACLYCSSQLLIILMKIHKRTFLISEKFISVNNLNVIAQDHVTSVGVAHGRYVGILTW